MYHKMELPSFIFVLKVLYVKSNCRTFTNFFLNASCAYPIHAISHPLFSPDSLGVQWTIRGKPNDRRRPSSVFRRDHHHGGCRLKGLCSFSGFKLLYVVFGAGNKTNAFTAQMSQRASVPRENNSSSIDIQVLYACISSILCR